MNTALTAICRMPGAGCVTRSPTGECSPCARRAEPSRERDIAAAQSPRAGAAARWQRILDLLDPGKRCGRGRRPPSWGARWSVPAPPRRWQGAGKRRDRVARVRKFLQSSRTGHHALDDAQALTSDRLSGGCQSPQPGERRHLDALQAEGEPSHDHHRPWSSAQPSDRHRRELQVILASAPVGAAVVVACTIPPATSGPPLHAHATADETFFVLSGVLLVDA